MTRLFPILHYMLTHHNVSLPQPRSSLAHLVGGKCSGVPLLGAFSSYLYIHSVRQRRASLDIASPLWNVACTCAVYAPRMHLRRNCIAVRGLSFLSSSPNLTLPILVLSITSSFPRSNANLLCSQRRSSCASETPCVRMNMPIRIHSYRRACFIHKD